MKEKVRELNEITNSFVNKVKDLINIRKIFGKTFIYDGMDYLKIVLNEMRQIKQILIMFGLDINFAEYKSIYMSDDNPFEQEKVIDNKKINTASNTNTGVF